MKKYHSRYSPAKIIARSQDDLLVLRFLQPKELSLFRRFQAFKGADVFFAHLKNKFIQYGVTSFQATVTNHFNYIGMNYKFSASRNDRHMFIVFRLSFATIRK